MGLWKWISDFGYGLHAIICTSLWILVTLPTRGVGFSDVWAPLDTDYWLLYHMWRWIFLSVGSFGYWLLVTLPHVALDFLACDKESGHIWYWLLYPHITLAFPACGKDPGTFGWVCCRPWWVVCTHKTRFDLATCGVEFSSLCVVER
jgi:hypothetical protein